MSAKDLSQRSTRRWQSIVLLVATIAAGAGAYAQDDSDAPLNQTILEIRVTGNEQLSDQAVLSNVRSRVGQVYDETVIRADERRLLETGRYTNVVVLRTQTTEGVIVTFEVAERELIALLDIRGNDHFNDARLRRELTFSAGSPLEPARIERGRVAIEDAYRNDGFYFVEVTLDQNAFAQRRVIFNVVEGARVRVKRIDFEGNDAYSDWSLRQKVRTRRAIWILTRGTLDEQQLARDAVNVQNYYRQEGYLDAQVDRQLTFNDEKTEAYVTFLVDEGPRYRIGEVRFEGNEVFSDPELRDRLDMTVGEYYTALGLQRDTQAVSDTYGEVGYLQARVEPDTLFADPAAEAPDWAEVEPGQAPALLILVYNVRESRQYHVGRVTIRGNDVTEDRVIRRQVGLFPGQLYNTVAVDRSRQRLLESRLFESVDFSPYGDAEHMRNLLVTVEEGRTAEFVVGVGVTTNSGVLGTIAFTQRNYAWYDWPESFDEFIRGQAFKGAGQTLRINIEPGTEVIRARIDWREPYLFDLPIQLGLGGYVFTRGRETYDETRMGPQASLGKLFKNRWYGELAVRYENILVDELLSDAPPEVIADQGRHDLFGVQGTLTRDMTDSRWLPSEGDRLSLYYEQIFGDYTFAKTGASYTRYWTLHLDALDRKHILAARVEADGIVGGDSPVFERYYGGGIGNIRGFSYRGISPRSAGTDKVIGGEFNLYAGAEYSFPLVGDNLRGVVFLDSGTVESDYEITTYRASAGFGFRLLIPFFGPVPMALDFGFPLSKDEQDDRELVSFSFGWVF